MIFKVRYASYLTARVSWGGRCSSPRGDDVSRKGSRCCLAAKRLHRAQQPLTAEPSSGTEQVGSAMAPARPAQRALPLPFPFPFPLTPGAPPGRSGTVQRPPRFRGSPRLASRGKALRGEPPRAARTACPPRQTRVASPRGAATVASNFLEPSRQRATLRAPPGGLRPKAAHCRPPLHPPTDGRTEGRTDGPTPSRPPSNRAVPCPALIGWRARGGLRGSPRQQEVGRGGKSVPPPDWLRRLPRALRLAARGAIWSCAAGGYGVREGLPRREGCCGLPGTGPASPHVRGFLIVHVAAHCELESQVGCCELASGSPVPWEGHTKK